ncbi:hypothetical protein F5884DRAFT_788434 [Xylogone sp. PMI_703]|nr:hypothetical protein F5884DRAFT_788434 [Xylogone sp. PMI_703]
MAVNIGLAQWYAIATAAFIGILAIRLLGSHAPVYFAPARTWFLRHVLYATFIRRRYFGGVSRFHALLIGTYIVANGFCMGLGIKSASDLIVRSGTMASINLIPLFLGGRTNMLANLLGISLHTYYLAHHWIGRVVIAQTIFHVTMVIITRRSWTWDSFHISGLSATSALALILFSSFFFARKLMFEVFLKVHFFCGIVVVLAVLKHSSRKGLSGAIFPLTSVALWVGNTIFRLIQVAYYNWGSKKFEQTGQASITPFLDEKKTNTTALRLTVKLQREMQIRPGTYAYLFFSDMGIRRRFQAHPFVIAWWDDSLRATELAFLIQPQSGISADLIRRNTIRSVTVDGPYGKDLHLDEYETVILIAKGIGIAGLLPYVRHMAYRRLSTAQYNDAYRRALITSKIDIYWVLEDDYQQDWISDWIRQIKEKDTENIILTFSCFYPHTKKREPPIKPDPKYYRFIYNKPAIPIITNLMNEQIARSAGRAKILVCGTSNFSETVRKATLETMAKHRDVEFAEVEFQPKGVRQGYPGIHSRSRDELEMESMTGGNPNVLTRPAMNSSKLASQWRGSNRRLRSQGTRVTTLPTMMEETETKSIESNIESKPASVAEVV